MYIHILKIKDQIYHSRYESNFFKYLIISLSRGTLYKNVQMFKIRRFMNWDNKSYEYNWNKHREKNVRDIICQKNFFKYGETFSPI